MMEKLLKLLMLLSGTRTYSVQEISDRFEVTDRTVYRHLDAIETAGFILERRSGRYRLEMDNTHWRNLEKLLHFSDEEVYILHQALGEIAGTSPIKDRLIKKLHTLYDLKALSRLRQDPFIENVKNLNQAIENRQEVVLRNYRSSHSEQISDRTVEPFSLTSDYAFVWCFDISDYKNKQFKLSRMQDVELLSKSWQHQEEHGKPFTDAFRMSADQSVGTVTAQLSLRAYNLLAEEFPLAQKYISSENGIYLLEVPVADYRGIGRFILGLPGEVDVRGSDEFKKFLKERRKIFNS